MRVVTFLYHDVIRSDVAESGFPGAGANVYKLSVEEFRSHLDALAAARTDAPVAVGAVEGTVSPWLMTFDDGGSSAWPLTSGLLGERGWIGHFFVTGDRIGTRGFVSRDDIRQLDAAGHVVGGHSFTHPPRMSLLSDDALLDEWKRSVDCLSDVLGRHVRTASVPGGFYSRRVAAAAAKAGVTDLFTSEPVVRRVVVEGCRIYGRYSVQRGTSPAAAVALAAGRPLPRTRLWISWNGRKLAKAVGGRHYITLKERILASREVDPPPVDRPD